MYGIVSLILWNSSEGHFLNEFLLHAMVYFSSSSNELTFDICIPSSNKILPRIPLKSLSNLALHLLSGAALLCGCDDLNMTKNSDHSNLAWTLRLRSLMAIPGKCSHLHASGDPLKRTLVFPTSERIRDSNPSYNAPKFLCPYPF